MTASSTGQRLILASQSPSRKKILEQAGIEFDVVVSQVDEQAVIEQSGPLSPAEEALVLARTKAESVAALPEARGALVLGCDSVFELDGVSYGKPYEVEVAVQRWQQMRGKTGTLHTGHWLVAAGTATTTAKHSWLGAVNAVEAGPMPGVPSQQLQSAGETVSAQVHFGEPSDEQIRGYAESGEPLLCAGAFTLEGRAAAFIDGVDGDPNAVIGLSPRALTGLLAELGVDVTELWSPRHVAQ